MESFNHKFYYKRSLEKKVIMSRNIKNIKVGDIIKFFGKLYSDKKYLHEVAHTVIEYKILEITENGVLLKTSNKYMFNNGLMHFSGRIFSSNFNIIDGNISSYTTENIPLTFNKGTKLFKSGFGHNEYCMIGNGLGYSNINLKILV